jgi:hypothetical protein
MLGTCTCVLLYILPWEVWRMPRLFRQLLNLEFSNAGQHKAAHFYCIKLTRILKSGPTMWSTTLDLAYLSRPIMKLIKFISDMLNYLKRSRESHSIRRFTILESTY